MSKTGSLLKGVGAGVLVAAHMTGGAALAQEATSLGTFQYWTAWERTGDEGKQCFISSEPQQSEPGDVDHGTNNFLVIHRQGLDTRNEVQALFGYALDGAATPEVSVDGQGYDMVVEDSAAWLASAGDEDGFVDAMKRGSEMVVEARSARGTNTRYTYSLLGVTDAMGAIDEACPAS